MELLANQVLYQPQSEAFHSFTEEILEISIYHANQKTKTMQAWENMAQDLETIQEETDG
jgi:hypothetical protein